MYKRKQGFVHHLGFYLMATSTSYLRKGVGSLKHMLKGYMELKCRLNSR